MKNYLVPLHSPYWCYINTIIYCHWMQEYTFPYCRIPLPWTETTTTKIWLSLLWQVLNRTIEMIEDRKCKRYFNIYKGHRASEKFWAFLQKFCHTTKPVKVISDKCFKSFEMFIQPVCEQANQRVEFPNLTNQQQGTLYPSLSFTVTKLDKEWGWNEFLMQATNQNFCTNNI